MDHDNFCTQAYSGRKASPYAEHSTEEFLTDSFRRLMETCALYQNITLPSDFYSNIADEDNPSDQLWDEFCDRPYVPISRGEGDDADVSPRLGGGNRGASIPPGVQPLGTPAHEMELCFCLPNIQVTCPACKRESTYLSLSSSSGNYYFRNPYPIFGEKTLQVFTLDYRCAQCRKGYLTFQIRRIGAKLQLTGRSVPFRACLSAEWPKQIRAIIEDAYEAAQANDLPAGYYHLRTAVEFYIKSELDCKVEDKIDGVELCEKYHKSADERLKTDFPSMTELYRDLSHGLHTRDVSAEGFTNLSKRFLGHLKAKALFSEFSKRENG